MCGSHQGLAATAVHSREAGYIYANCYRRNLKSLQRQGGPYISADVILQQLAVERQISDDPLQARILVLKRLQPLHIGRQHTGVFFPVVIGRMADPCLSADISNRYTFITLLQNERVLSV